MSVTREMNQRPQGSTGSGAFVPTYHREMLMDRRRVRAFQKAIERLGGQDRSFLELGPGTGVMSAHAARCFGRVFAVERDPVMYETCRENLRRLGLLDTRVTLIHGDALECDLPRVDVVMAEMMSTLMIHEPQVPVMNRARKMLTPTGVLLPARVVNTLTLGWSKFTAHGVQFRAPYTLFTGVPGPEPLTESRVLYVADFMAGEVPMDISVSVDVEAFLDSEINSVILTSHLQLAPGITFGASDSIDPPMVVPIEPVRAAAGQRLRVHVSYRHYSDWHTFSARVEVGHGIS